MESKGLILLVGMVFMAVVTSAVDGPLKTEDKAAIAASKVVEALEDHSFRADSIAPDQQPAVAGTQDHPKVRIVPRKGVPTGVVTSAVNATTSTPNIAASVVPKASEAQLGNITTAAPQVSVANNNNNNSTVVSAGNATLSTNSTQQPAKNALGNATTPAVAVPSASKPATMTSSTTTTTTTSTTTRTKTTTTTTTTTTKPPKKPKITFSVDDEPRLVQAAKPGYSSGTASVSDPNGRLHVEEPLAELSKELLPDSNPGHREYVLPVVTLIFAIPLLAGLFLLSYRRAKEFWLTRHYRRMDFLVDGMYNY